MSDVKLSQEKFDELMVKLTEQADAIAKLTEKVEDQEKRIPDMATTMAVMDSRNQAAENAPRVVILKKIDGYSRTEGKDGPQVELPFTGKENCCPWCTENKQKSLLDRTKMGRWACRMCGKHWYEEALGQPYSRKLESFIKTNENPDMPEPTIRRNGEVIPTKDDTGGKLHKLEAENQVLRMEMGEMRDILLGLQKAAKKDAKEAPKEALA